MSTFDKALLERYRRLGTIEQLEALVHKEDPSERIVAFPVLVGDTVYYLTREQEIVKCKVQSISTRLSRGYWELVMVRCDTLRTIRCALSQYENLYFSTIADAHKAKSNRIDASVRKVGG